MRASLILVFVLFATLAKSQSPCSNVKLYDQMMVRGDQPMFHKLKKFDITLIPDSTLLEIKSEVIRHTSAQFYQQLKIKSVKLFDSAVATAWSWTHPPIKDRKANPVYYFYAVVFETTFNKTPFAFRVDFLKSGELLNKNQLAFFGTGKLNIIGCKEIAALVKANTTQPIALIEEMYLAYSLKEQAIVWSIASFADSKTGIKYFKDINALTGKIIQQSFVDVNAPPPPVDELKVKTDN
jgi:hypothetical protein